MHLKEGIRNCACANSGKDIFEPSFPVLAVSRQIWCVTISDQKLARVQNLETGGLNPGGNKWSEIAFSESDNSRDFHCRTLAVGRVVNH